MGEKEGVTAVAGGQLVRKKCFRDEDILGRDQTE